jgi:hypothetical protein
MQDYRNKKTLENIMFGVSLMAIAGVVYFILNLF